MIPQIKINSKFRGGSEAQFPGKLHNLMKHVETQGLQHIISWVLEGKAFLIHDADKLVELLPMFFSQTKYRSFRRQLNMWKFERIMNGPHRGAFVHPFFVRGKKSLCNYMSRHLSSAQHQILYQHLHAGESQTQIQSQCQRTQTSMNTAQSSQEQIVQTRSPLHIMEDIFPTPIEDLAPVPSKLDEIASLFDDSEKSKIPPLFSMDASFLEQDRHEYTRETTTGSYQDGDLLSFEGRQFFFVDYIQ